QRRPLSGFRRAPAWNANHGPCPSCRTAMDGMGRADRWDGRGSSAAACDLLHRSAGFGYYMGHGRTRAVRKIPAVTRLAGFEDAPMVSTIGAPSDQTCKRYTMGDAWTEPPAPKLRPLPAGGTTRVGIGAARYTLSATLPTMSRWNPSRAWVHIATASA